MIIREITIFDHDNLISFWKANYFVNEMDNKKRFELFLEKNHDLSFLAEENGIILGTALGSFDGRRGYIQKVVVDRLYRKKGLGQQLVKKVIKKLQILGVTYIPISVEEEKTHFYENCGFKKTKQIPMNMNL
ncbi:MAG: GNAT family N-acetyltransferase [Patescibacteria group bacterium]|jgi:ribosomal protein S18 acetylase RimI-like enzyme